jgi:3-hydroxyisobutyrate dehydrogenase-like beta-hydroxyacid dehydrogenase
MTNPAAPDNPSSPPVGLIGVGLLGTALAERLLSAGFGVLGWDVDPARRDALLRLGGNPAPAVNAVPVACQRIILSLPNSDISADVLRDISDFLRPRHIVVDTTTGDPRSAEELAARLATRGVAYLDATVSGSSAQVRAAEATVMVGGPQNAFEHCRDLFRCFARHVFHVGSPGSGSRLKLVTNLVLGLNRAALAEALVFARSMGLDLNRTLEVLRNSAAYSRIMDTKGDKMVRGDFDPQARLSQHLKDVRLILEAAADAGLNLPLSQTHKELLERAEAAGFGQLDNSAVIRAYDTPPAQGASQDAT